MMDDGGRHALAPVSCSTHGKGTRTGSPDLTEPPARLIAALLRLRSGQDSTRFPAEAHR